MMAEMARKVGEMPTDQHPQQRIFSFRGFEDPDLSSLEGLEPEALEALEALTDAGMTAEQITAMAAENEPDEKDQEIAGVKEALRKERLLRRNLQKQLKAAGVKPPVKKVAPGKTPTAASETDEGDDEELKAEVAKSARLASQLATNALNTTIMSVLGSSDKKLPKFQDVDDVLSMIDRSQIDVEQDDDDPSTVTVDKDTVKDALKALAKKKPHLLIRDEGEGGGDGKGGKPPTGSKFGGKPGDNEGSRQDALLKKFPALRR